MYTKEEVLKNTLEYFSGDELATKVWMEKYALRDGEGNYLEKTPDDTHKRLAKEFARIEKKYPNPMSEEEIYELFKNYKYVSPQGSPTSAIGNEYQIQSAGNCFVAGTKVFTIDGVKNIEDVVVGDKVVTHKGRIKKVVQVHKNSLNERKIFGVKIYRTPFLKVTDNHKFMSISKEQLKWGDSPKFNSIKYLRVGDYIQIPSNNEKLSLEYFDLNEVFSDEIFEYDKRRYKIERNNGKIRLITISSNGKFFKKHRQFIPQIFEVDKDFAYFLGLWYGDGCIFGENSSFGNKKTKTRNAKTKFCTQIRGITFTFGAHEKKLIDFVLNFLQKKEILFDLNENKKIDNSTQIVVHSPILGYAFEHFFGRRFDGKRFHKSMFSWDKDLIKSLVMGLIDSDGVVCASGDIRVALCNPNLIREFYHVCRINNILVGYSETTHKERVIARLDFGRNDSFRYGSKKNYSDDRLIENLSNKTNHVKELEEKKFVEILSKTPLEEKHEYVYNFGVEDDHSYSVEGLICMNCFVIEEPYDSYGGILKADQEMAQLMKRRAGVGISLDKIRPKGLLTKNAARTTDGISLFMERFSNTCREVAQGGRRGALLESLSVHHPEVETFINIKKDRKKVTGANLSLKITDEFMTAVKEKKAYEQRFPVGKNENYIIKNNVSAKKIWDQIVESSWENAEPGILFIDTILKNSLADIYGSIDKSFVSTSTNPCFSGDTKIAVADGRNYATIKELADIGDDVPVYSVAVKTGEVSIKMARNPRITGYDKKLVRIILDDGSFFEVTKDHEIPLLSGEKKIAKNLKKGDSLHRFSKRAESISQSNSKQYYRIRCDTFDSTKNQIFEHRLISKFFDFETWDKKYIDGKRNGWMEGGVVVHHKDYNSLNNTPSNLKVMTFKEHSNLHSRNDTQGEKNGRCYSSISNEDIREHAIFLSKKLGRRFSRKEWQEYAGKNDLPKAFTIYRETEEYKTVLELSKWSAKKCGFDYIDEDPRVVSSYLKALDQGYNASIINGMVSVVKFCEYCKKEFICLYSRREQSYCSSACVFEKYNTDKIGVVKSLETKKKKQEITKKLQTKIYSELSFQLGRPPLMKEWESECKNLGVSCRVGKKLKFCFKSFSEVKKAGENYNHKVVRVEEIPGEHIVYNLTVDDNHTVALITKEYKNSNNNINYSGVFVNQCGEIPLGADSCRLMLLNLLSFVDDPYTKEARFNFEKFYNISIKAQRLMDDLVDLEEELIEKIIKKIKSDPEPENVKQIELDLWKEYKRTCVAGRRTGLGATALGDVIASLGFVYGDENSIKITEDIYRTMALGAHYSSCLLAKERGCFPLYDFFLEEKSNCPYLKRIWKEDEKIYKMEKEFGRRNISLTTSAPAGSMSCLMKVTSGIEPVIFLEYNRRVKVDPKKENIKVDFVDEVGDSWQEYKIYHHGVKKWMEITGESDISKSPYYNSTSANIDWKKSVDIQAAAQRWISHSISKTCNVPKNIDKKVIEEIFFDAWEKGLKGITIYRDGSRSGVLIEKKNDKHISYSTPPKRPRELECDIHHITVGGEPWIVFTGLMPDQEGINVPYEVFAGESKKIQIPKRYNKGIIVKRERKTTRSIYDLEAGIGDDKLVVSDIVETFDDLTDAAFTRTISLALRHGTPIRFVVEQLLKDKDSDMFSFSRAVARVLKKYIKDGEKSSLDKVCPNCNDEGLVYKEGCVSCLSCGWSRCS